MPSVEYLRSIFTYNPRTGYIDRLVSKRGVPAGRAGSAGSGGYRFIRLDHKRYSEHRLAWMLFYGEHIPSGYDIDHINGVRDDNSIGNLRLASPEENNQNLAVYKTNTSGYTGVWFNKSTNRWHSVITKDKKNYFLGAFSSKEEASVARQAAKESLHAFHPTTDHRLPLYVR